MNEGGRSLFPWEEEQPGSRTAANPDAAAASPADALDAAGGDEATHAAEAAEEAATAAAADVSPPSVRPEEAIAAAPPRGAERTRRPDAGQRPLVRKEYYSISEVADIVGLPAHVLRYWESQFSVLNPSKNRSGNRVYQRKEIKLILLVKQLLHDEKYTVEGAKQKLEQLRRGGAVGAASQRALDQQLLDGLREDLLALNKLLRTDTA